jgi:hypothetical protein
MSRYPQFNIAWLTRFSMSGVVGTCIFGTNVGGSGLSGNLASSVCDSNLRKTTTFRLPGDTQSSETACQKQDIYIVAATCEPWMSAGPVAASCYRLQKMKMTHNSRVPVTNEPSGFPTETPSLRAAGKTRIPAEPKASTKTVQGNREPSDWDFRANGLLFWEDVKEAHELKREDPDAFKSSIRAQKIVAFVEYSLKSQRALEREFEKNIPRAFRDLSIARDRKRKAKERLAAIDRFAKPFGKIPMNVGIALFHWLDGGNKNEIIQALGQTAVKLTITPQTGELVEVDGRGRRRSSATVKRIELAARLSSDGISQRKMAARLFPNISQEQAYAKTRDFFHKYRYLIAIMAHRFGTRSQSSRKPHR